MKWAMVVKGGAYRVSGSQGAGQKGPGASRGGPKGVSRGQGVGRHGPVGSRGRPAGS